MILKPDALPQQGTQVSVAAGTCLTRPRVLASGHKQTHFPLHCLPARASSRTSNRLSTVTTVCSCQPPQHYVLRCDPQHPVPSLPVPWLTAPGIWASCPLADEGRLLLTQDRGPCPSLCLECFSLGSVTFYKSLFWCRLIREASLATLANVVIHSPLDSTFTVLVFFH